MCCQSHRIADELSVAKFCMSSSSYISYCLLLGMAWCHAFADQGKEGKALYMEVLGHSEWKDITITVHSTTEPKAFQVPARKSWFQCKILYLGDANVPVTAFVTKKGNVWLGPEGPELNFYIETEKGVLRGCEQGLGEILWADSLITRSRDTKNSLDELIAQFERKPDGDALHDAGIICRRENDKIRYTHFREPLDWSHRLPISSGRLTGASIAKIEVTGNTVRVELENKDPEINYAVSVWINLKSKGIIKAVEKGKQVYPK